MRVFCAASLILLFSQDIIHAMDEEAEEKSSWIEQKKRKTAPRSIASSKVLSQQKVTPYWAKKPQPKPTFSRHTRYSKKVVYTPKASALSNLTIQPEFEVFAKQFFTQDLSHPVLGKGEDHTSNYKRIRRNAIEGEPCAAIILLIYESPQIKSDGPLLCAFKKHFAWDVEEKNPYKIAASLLSSKIYTPKTPASLDHHNALKGYIIESSKTLSTDPVLRRIYDINRLDLFIAKDPAISKGSAINAFHKLYGNCQNSLESLYYSLYFCLSPALQELWEKKENTKRVVNAFRNELPLHIKRLIMNGYRLKHIAYLHTPANGMTEEEQALTRILIKHRNH